MRNLTDKIAAFFMTAALSKTELSVILIIYLLSVWRGYVVYCDW